MPHEIYGWIFLTVIVGAGLFGAYHLFQMIRIAHSIKPPHQP
jgi:hypothetical protein